MRQSTNHHWFRLWLVAWSAPSHYLNQLWNIVNWTLRNKLQWNFNRNSYIFIQRNRFENVVWKTAAICLGLNVLTEIDHVSEGIGVWISGFIHINRWDALSDPCPNFDVDLVHTLRPRQNGRHFADDIFKWVFVNQNVWIPIKISLKFVPKGPINNIQALV